jgi:hypothetical protein
MSFLILSALDTAGTCGIAAAGRGRTGAGGACCSACSLSFLLATERRLDCCSAPIFRHLSHVLYDLPFAPAKQPRGRLHLHLCGSIALAFA